MSDQYKILGQILAPVSIDADPGAILYTVPEAGEVQVGGGSGPVVAPKSVSQISQALVNSIIVCNTTATNRNFDLALRSVDGTVVDANYLVRTRLVAAKETKVFTLGLTLAPGNVLRVAASLAGVIAVTAMGIEVT